MLVSELIISFLMVFFAKLKRIRSENLLVVICLSASVLMESAIQGLFLCTCLLLGLLGMIHNHRNAEIQGQEGQHEVTKFSGDISRPLRCSWMQTMGKTPALSSVHQHLFRTHTPDGSLSFHLVPFCGQVRMALASLVLVGQVKHSLPPISL